MDSNLLMQAIQNHQWATVVLCVTLGIVAAAKLPAAKAQWDRLPAVARPFVPVALGLLGGIAEAVLAGKPWAYAMIMQFMASLPAVLLALPSTVIRSDPTFPPSEAPTKKD